MTDVDDLTVEQRLAVLEARLGVGVSQIAAQWAQDVSGLVVHRFPTTVGLQAWAAPNGVLAIAVDTGLVWQRRGGVWSQYTPWTGTNTGVALNFTVATQQASLLNIPADPGPRVASISCFIRVDLFANNSAVVELRFDGFAQAQFAIPRTTQLIPDGLNNTWNVSLQANSIAVPVGRVVPVAVVVGVNAPGAGVGQTYATYYQNRVDAAVFPKGN